MISLPFQEQVRSGDASAMGLFELGAVMLRRKFYPAATKYLNQAIEKWDGDDQDLAQVTSLNTHLNYSNLPLHYKKLPKNKITKRKIPKHLSFALETLAIILVNM